MTKIFFIHPSVNDVESFLSFTMLEGTVDPGKLEWCPSAPDLLFASEWVFYRKDLFETFRKLYDTSRIKIAWMGEAVSADPNIFDYIVGFDASRSDDSRFIRLPSPLDMFNRFIPTARNEIRDTLKAKALHEEKDRFCNFLYSNSMAHPMRDRIFHAIDAYRRVDSLGRHLNNTDLPGTGYGGHYSDCTLLKKPYRFSIAAENAEYDGYTTEKIFTSLAAHTVPIYWGNPSVALDVNPECFIDVRNFKDMDELIRYVEKVNVDRNLWADIVSKPWLTPSQEEYHRKRTADYRSKMSALLTGLPVRRVPEGYHVELYRKQFFKEGFCFGNARGKLVPNTGKPFRGKALRCLELLSPLLPDKVYIVMKYTLMLGVKPDLENPRTFNEKIQWAKLNDRNPLYSKLVDKAAVKEWVAAKIGADHVIPTLGCWKSFSEIDFDALPSSFVLKCTHDSGSAVIVRNKSSFNRAVIRKSLTDALAHDYSRDNREWPYSQVPRRIIAEPYLSDLEGATDDYKFFCTDGKVRFLFVATGRSGGNDSTRFDFFDPDWKHLPFTNGHPNAVKAPVRPDNFQQMLEIAAKLSEGLPFVRVDLYNLDGRILFGEYTFSHWGGFKPFDPPQWDLKLGEMLSGE